MAHKYSNFTSAYNDASGQFSDLKARIGYIGNSLTAAHNHAIADEWLYAIDHLILAIADVQHMFNDLVDLPETNYEASHFYESLYWAAKEPTGGVVTMAGILSAMLGATYEQVKYFIGYEEAYRATLWNEWYNYEFYAALARGFQQKTP